MRPALRPALMGLLATDHRRMRRKEGANQAASNQGRRLSPGFTSPRSTLTALAEDLASHGYVAAGIDHTYESYATAFPDGRVTTCLAREPRQRGYWDKEK